MKYSIINQMGLKGYWKFNSGQGEIAFDRSRFKIMVRIIVQIGLCSQQIWGVRLVLMESMIEW